MTEKEHDLIMEQWEDIHCLLSAIGNDFHKDEVPFYIYTAKLIINKIDGNAENICINTKSDGFL